MLNVASIGLATIDEYILLENFPIEDSKAIAQNSYINYGGSATNFAIISSKLPLITNLYCVIGSDYYKDFISFLNLSKIKQFIFEEPSNSFKVRILINKENSSRTAIALDGARFKEYHAIDTSNLIHYDIIYLDGSLPSSKNHLIFSFDRNINDRIFFNLEFIKSDDLIFFQKAGYGIISEQAANQLKSNYSYTDLLKSLWHNGNKIKGITFGSKGSILYDGSKIYKCGAIKVSSNHTSGAGDAFQCGLSFGLLNNWDIEKCHQFATIIAYLHCKKAFSEEISSYTSLIDSFSGQIDNSHIINIE